jgi:pyruvate/2-oxoglutarate/acetoin dehydrogenase E1 component
MNCHPKESLDTNPGEGAAKQSGAATSALLEVGIRDNKSLTNAMGDRTSPHGTYKGELTAAMEELAQDPLVRFIGYGVKIGGRALGTLKNVPDHQLIEMPVAENLMVGFAIGLSLKGFKPVVFIERFDFILNALDAIVNHLDKIETISKGEFRPTMILRIVVGNKTKPLFTGETHTQDFSDAFSRLVNFPTVNLRSAPYIRQLYRNAHEDLPDHSTALIEYKDLM